MKDYNQYCPISKAVEVLGERWTFMVMRELLIGSRKFNDIARGLPGMSRTMLSKRLRQLEQAGIIERDGVEYIPTPAGEELRAIVFSLGEWSAKWLLGDPMAEECDPEVMMWWGHSRLDVTSLPDRRVVLYFSFSDHTDEFWVVVENGVSSICLSDPGFEVDATVSTDLATLARVWNDRETVRSAVKQGDITFHGQSAIVRRLPQVLTIPPADLMGRTAESPRPRVYS